MATVPYSPSGSSRVFQNPDPDTQLNGPEWGEANADAIDGMLDDAVLIYSADESSDFTIDETHLGKMVDCDNAVGIEVTVPVMYEGFWCILAQANDGQIELIEDGTTIKSTPGTLSRDNESLLVLIWKSSTVVRAGGDLSA